MQTSEGPSETVLLCCRSTLIYTGGAGGVCLQHLLPFLRELKMELEKAYPVNVLTVLCLISVCSF